MTALSGTLLAVVTRADLDIILLGHLSPSIVVPVNFKNLLLILDVSYYSTSSYLLTQIVELLKLTRICNSERQWQVVNTSILQDKESAFEIFNVTSLSIPKWVTIAKYKLESEILMQ